MDRLAELLRRQRWFGGKARTIADVAVIDEGALPGTAARLAVLGIRFADGGEERYFAPLLDGEDAIGDERTCRSLLELLRRGGRVDLAHGRIAATGGPDGSRNTDLPIRRTSADQSNTSVVFGDELIMKVFRRVEPGLNPDVEIGRFLTSRGFTRVPALVGDADYVTDDGPGSSVLMLQPFVPSEGDAWHAMLRFADVTSAAALAETLGRRTGELHDTLASDADDPAFAPERYTRTDLAVLADRMRAFGARQLALLRAATLAGSARALAAQLLDAEAALLARFDALRDLADAGRRIRCHGDYHLGQTLVTDGDVWILDFEGEPARSLAERRAKSSPLRDVAGMLRSFGYAAGAAHRDPSWETVVAGAFLRGYAAATDHVEFLPPRGRAFQIVLDAFVLDKALYELGYELNNRPDWVTLPLAALVRVELPRSDAWPSSQSAEAPIPSASAPPPKA